MKKILFIALIVAAELASAQDFEIWVSDAGNFTSGPWQVLKYDQNGENPEVFTDAIVASPQDIVFLEGAGEVLVSNLRTNRITRHDIITGELLGIFTTGITAPTRMKIGEDGLLYVLQWQGNGRVFRYQLDGTFVDEFTQLGVTNAIGMDWDSEGNFYISSFDAKTVRKFDGEGNHIGLIVNSGLQGPTNIWFDADGDLLVLDWTGGAVRKYSAAGASLGNFITGLNQPEGVDFLPNGNILIGDGGTSSVKEFTPAGAFVKDIVPSGSGGLLQPNAVVIRHLAPDFKLTAGLNDAWVNEAAPFQGMFITVFPVLNIVFVAWFTFDSEIPLEEQPATFGASDQRWVTGVGAIDGNKVEIKMELTTGGIFNGSDPLPTQNTSYGTMTLEFQNCSSASVVYNFPSVPESGEFNMARVVDSNVELCETLSAE
jgi:hypothetical protein